MLAVLPEEKQDYHQHYGAVLLIYVTPQTSE
jgi:hypothetical protein